MKKNFLYSMMAAFIVLFASCNQEEIVSGTNDSNGKVTIMVGMPGGSAATRAMPTVEGKVRRCIMQVVNAEGTAIEGSEMKQVAEVTGESVSFSFAEPDGEYSVVFWADYVNDLTKDFIYKTEALPTISYVGNRDNMFTAAGDAFCGKIDKGTTSVTLKRPFNKIVVGSTNKEVFKDYTHIAINTFSVPNNYNIFGKTTSGDPWNIRLDKTTINDTETGEWAYFYIFAPVTTEATPLSLDITLSKGEEAEAESIAFTATTTLPTDDNLIGDMDIKDIPTEKIEVEISFDDKFKNEPAEPVDPSVIKVGSYINAKGEAVATAEDAVAVVFAMASEITDNDDDISTYGVTDKTIKAYAVSLENATARLNWTGADGEEVATLAQTTPKYQGYAATQVLLNENDGICKKLTGGMFKTFNEWLASNKTNSENLSQWYIPSFAQLTILTELVFGETADPTFSAIVTPQSFLTNPGQETISPSKGWYLTSSSINDSNKISTYTVGNGNDAAAEASAYTCSSGSAALTYTTRGFIRPVLTIFE